MLRQLCARLRPGRLLTGSAPSSSAALGLLQERLAGRECSRPSYLASPQQAADRSPACQEVIAPPVRLASWALAPWPLAAAHQASGFSTTAFLSKRHSGKGSSQGGSVVSTVTRREQSVPSAGRSRRRKAAQLSQQPSPEGELCPLHACLLRYGITSPPPALSETMHKQLSAEYVAAEVEPKLAALRAEGLTPTQLDRLLVASKGSILYYSYEGTFLPNLQLLRRIAAHRKSKPHPQAPQLTEVGKLLARGPVMAASFLGRDPALTQRLLRWLETGLGITEVELAGCSQLFRALIASEASCKQVAALLEELGVPASSVPRAFLANPSHFWIDPALIRARISCLQTQLQVGAADAVALVMRQPILLGLKLGDRLPALLSCLDGLMGEAGGGRALVDRDPTVGTATAAAAERCFARLAARGFSQDQIRDMVSKAPNLLKYNLDSPLQQQKLDWIQQVSPWRLEDFLCINAAYFTKSTARLAGRLAFMQQHGLQLPESPAILATYSDKNFMAAMGRRLGLKLGKAEWKVWQEGWLQTEEGQRWGYTPLNY